jgi:hypothetical protein
MTEEIIKSRGDDELLSCSFCHKLVSTEIIITTRNKKYVCEECFDPVDPDQWESGATTPDMEKVKEKQNDFNLSYTFASDSKKNKEKAIEINAEEENNKVQIPKELNIIDCPPDYKDDKEWFRKQFRNFWRLFNSDSEWVFAIHDRGSCKSKNDAIIILYNIAMSSNFEGCFVMRNWDEPTRQTKEYFKKIINEFDSKIWQGERTTKDKSQWGLLWLSTYKGVSFKKSMSDKAGELRCHFFSLFAADQGRTLINNPVKIAVFDECIPTRKNILKKGWDMNEPSDFMELMKSVGRGTRPKKVFTGNPNDSFYSCWFLVQHFEKELENLSKWYWKNRPRNLEKWLKWTWIKELKKGNKTLQLQKIATTKEDFDNYEEGNWDNFFAKMEDLKIVEHKNGAEPVHVFNNCIQYISKQNYFYYIDINSKKISERDRKLLKELPEIYVNDEQRLRSRQLAKWDRRGEAGRIFQQSLLRHYETDMLFFADMNAKERMETFLGKRKIIEGLEL